MQNESADADSGSGCEWRSTQNYEYDANVFQRQNLHCWWIIVVRFDENCCTLTSNKLSTIRNYNFLNVEVDKHFGSLAVTTWSVHFLFPDVKLEHIVFEENIRPRHNLQHNVTENCNYSNLGNVTTWTIVPNGVKICRYVQASIWFYRNIFANANCKTRITVFCFHKY